MSQPFKIKDNRRISSEVDLLLDSGFTPDAIMRFLKSEYNLGVGRATIYRYRKDHYKPKPYRKAVKEKIFKDCGRFIDVVEAKVAIAEIFKHRIARALKQEERISITLKTVDESIMRLNTVLNELYSMYQDMGLLPVRDERISIDTTVTEREEKVNRLEVLVKDFKSIDRSKLAQEIRDNINKLKKLNPSKGGEKNESK